MQSKPSPGCFALMLETLGLLMVILAFAAMGPEGGPFGLAISGLVVFVFGNRARFYNILEYYRRLYDSANLPDDNRVGTSDTPPRGPLPPGWNIRRIRPGMKFNGKGEELT